VTLSGGYHLVNRGSMTTTTDTVNGWNTYLYFYNASTFENAGTLTLTDNATFTDQDVSANLFQNDAGTTVSYTGSTNAQSVSLNVNATNNGTINVLKGTLFADRLTNLASGVLTGGTYTATGTLDVGAAITTNAATITVNPGGKIASGAANALSGLRVNSGSLTLGQPLAYNASLANSGTLSVTSGTLQPSSFTQSAGTTTVAVGAALRAGTTGSGAITISGGTLTGNGSVLGNLSGAGIVQPGSAAGALSVVGSYSPATTGTLAIGIQGPSAPGTDFGQLSVTGAAHLAGALALTTAPAFNPTPGSTYTIVSATSLTGTFASISGQIDQAAGVYYSVSYTATSVVLTVTALPSLSIANAGTAAPVSGTTTLNVGVTLSGVSPFTTTATYATSNGTAVAGTDYTATTGTVTIPAGSTTASIPVTVLAQAIYGPTKSFTVTLSAPSNATIATASATGSITNPNPMPSLGIAAASVNAPTTGTTTTNVGVTLSAPSQFNTTVNFATSDGTALAGTDYTATSGTLTFPAGTTSKSITVTILARPTAGPTKNFTVTLSSPANATIATSSSSVSISNAPTGTTVTSVSPNALVVGAANKTLTVTGSGFTSAEVPSFSAVGITVVSKAFVSSTTVTVKVTVGAATPVGPSDVTITTSAGAGVCTGCLSIDAVPKITTIAPVPALGKTTLLTVTGSGFQAGLVPTTTIPGATFGAVTGQTATTFQVAITVPLSDTAGNYNIVVTNPDGGKATKAVAVPPVPTVTSVAPNSIGAAATGIILTVTGTGFNATEVPSFSVAGFKVVTKTYVSPTTITLKVNTAATTPVGAASVTITTSGGAGTCVGCLTVDAAPKLTTVTPVPAHGASTVLTVTGTGLQAGLVASSTVPGATFGAVTGQTATTFQVQITIPPATLAGTYSFVVTNPDGGKATKTISVS
ncbi:MAG TPA: Calx-beta domain-containing protein, partial [Acidimicrobiales bacterium]